jgi:hypothetical protein
MIDLNIKLNNVENKVKSNCGDAISYMHDCSKKNSTKLQILPILLLEILFKSTNVSL